MTKILRYQYGIIKQQLQILIVVKSWKKHNQGVALPEGLVNTYVAVNIVIITISTL